MIELSVSLASNGVVKVPGYEQLVRFGYTKNRGVYRLVVSATGEWEGLTIRAFWHVPDGKDPASSLVVDGYADVPASVTAQPGNGCITFEGSDGTKTVTSADLRYRVSVNSGTEDGTDPEPGTPAWQQLVDAVHTDATAAEQAKTDAQTAAREAATSAGNADQSAQEAADSLQELKDGIANGDFKGEPGEDGQSPVVTVTPIENGHRVSITDKDGTKIIDVSNGADGKDGTQIDDTAVGTDAWSSKHIVDVLCPPLDETGNPVVCYPVAGYLLGCKVSWEPTQAGEGEPYPAGGGPQLLDISRCTATVGKPYGLTITIDGDIIKCSGVPSAEVTSTQIYSFAVASSDQEELRGKGYKVTAWPIKGKVSNVWGLRTADESSLAIAAELSPGVDTDIQLRLMVSKDTPTAYAPYENIRPIKGRDSVTVTRCGENLFNPAWMPEKTLNNGLTWTITSDGTVTANGTANGTAYYNSNYFSLPAGTYTISAMSHFRISVRNLDAGDTTIAAQQIGEPCTFTVENYIQKATLFFAASGTLDNVSAKPQIEKGTTATTYAPYTGQTSTLTLPRIIYGGTVDAVTGDGNENTKIITLDGNELKFTKVNIYINLPAHSAPGISKGGIICCSHFNRRLFAVNTTYEFCFLLESDMTSLFASVDDLNAYLAAQYAAGTPVQIAYKLAEPVPFTATGAQPIHALSGVNTVLTDADSATVTGRADPIKRITDLEDAVASMT